jgi:hypothetical protein
LINRHKEEDMLKRIRKATLVVAGLAALALGGSAIAGAATNGSTAPAQTPAVTAPADNDTVQSGDQTTPDVAGANEAADPADTPDSASEPAGTEKADGNETAGSEKAADDGPGGWADEAQGNANADTQQSGVN